MPEVICTLDKTLKEIGISKNKLAVEAKIRPNTVSDLANERAKAINFETLAKILEALNRLAKENPNINRKFGAEDVIIYID